MINNISPTVNKDIVKYDKHLEVDVQKLIILLSATGSKIAQANFNVKEKTAILNTGDKIVYNNAITVVTPMAFLIKTLLTIIKSKPSLRKPPTIGIEFDIAYFAAFIEIPS